MPYTFNPFTVNLDYYIKDHGKLSGLGDDDHTIYLLADGTRALAGNWDMGSYTISNVDGISHAGLGDLEAGAPHNQSNEVAVDGGTTSLTLTAGTLKNVVEEYVILTVTPI